MLVVLTKIDPNLLEKQVLWIATTTLCFANEQQAQMIPVERVHKLKNIMSTFHTLMYPEWSECVACILRCLWLSNLNQSVATSTQKRERDDCIKSRTQMNTEKNHMILRNRGIHVNESNLGCQDPSQASQLTFAEFFCLIMNSSHMASSEYQWWALKSEIKNSCQFPPPSPSPSLPHLSGQQSS